MGGHVTVAPIRTKEGGGVASHPEDKLRAGIRRNIHNADKPPGVKKGVGTMETGDCSWDHTKTIYVVMLSCSCSPRKEERKHGFYRRGVFHIIS